MNTSDTGETNASSWTDKEGFFQVSRSNVSDILDQMNPTSGHRRRSSKPQDPIQMKSGDLCVMSLEFGIIQLIGPCPLQVKNYFQFSGLNISGRKSKLIAQPASSAGVSNSKGLGAANDSEQNLAGLIVKVKTN